MRARAICHGTFVGVNVGRRRILANELHGPIQLRFEARLDGHPLPATSQALVVHRTRFSS